MTPQPETRLLTDKQVFTTDLFQPRRRVDEFQDRFGSFWGPVQVRTRDAGQFFSSVETTRLGALRFNRLRFQSLAFHRRARDHDGVPFMAMAFPRSGEARIYRGASEFVFGPGALCFVRHGKPDLTAIPDHYVTDNIQIPLHMLEQRIVHVPERLQLALTPGTSAKVVEHFVIGLWSELAHVGPEEESLLENQLCDLLARILSTPREASGTETAALRNQRESILHRLDCMASDPGLSPQRIACHLGMSVSQLHRIFASGEATVMAEVRALRVRRAQALLVSRRHRHTQIAEIARACGFTSQQDFARVFRHLCGTSPSQFRHANGETCSGTAGDSG